MDRRVLAIANKIEAGDATWKTDIIRDWDRIKFLQDTGLLDRLLAPVNPGTQVGANLVTPLIGGVAIDKVVAAYGVGTAYSLTNAQAAIDLGTTDPAIVIDEPGTYLIHGQFHLARAGATVAAETATLKARRTNNTAADVSVLPVIDLPASTTLTDTLGFFPLPVFIYQTPRSDDAISLFGAVSAALGAGTIDVAAIGTFLLAQRIGDATA